MPFGIGHGSGLAGSAQGDDIVDSVVDDVVDKLLQFAEVDGLLFTEGGHEGYTRSDKWILHILYYFILTFFDHD